MRRRPTRRRWCRFRAGAVRGRCRRRPVAARWRRRGATSPCNLRSSAASWSARWQTRGAWRCWSASSTELWGWRTRFASIRRSGWCAPLRRCPRVTVLFVYAVRYRTVRCAGASAGAAMAAVGKRPGVVLRQTSVQDLESRYHHFGSNMHEKVRAPRCFSRCWLVRSAVALIRTALAVPCAHRRQSEGCGLQSVT